MGEEILETTGGGTVGTDLLVPRIVTFSKVSVAAGASLVLAQLVLSLTVHGYADPLGLGLFLSIGAVLPPAAMWLHARSRAPKRRALEIGDATAPVLSAAMYSAFLAVLSPQHHFERLLLFALTLIAVFRAALVPSTVARTIASTAGMAVPLTIATAYSYTRHVPVPGDALDAAETPFAMAAWTLMCWVTAAVVCVVVTSIVYGLRAEIRRARQLGQYTLGERLGSGGMGTVYRARHALLRRPTAVKVLKAAGNERAMARFEREVQLTAMLTHPNTVTVYDFGRTTEGLFYYAMELLDGASLAEVVEATGPQPVARVVAIIHMVADALEEAHAIGLTHRDIKPANIILARQGGRADIAKVVDFGLVKLGPHRDLVARGELVTHRELDSAVMKSATPRGGIDITHANEISGTPLYMPPESLLAPEDVGPVADLYSLGAVAYYLLTGTHVFRGGSIVEILECHLHEAPEPPSKRLGGAIPADLEALVLACLAKDPADRPRSAAELRDRLAACKGVGRWTEKDARSWWDANKRAVVRAHREATSEREIPTIGIDLAARGQLSPLTLADVSTPTMNVGATTDKRP